MNSVFSLVMGWFVSAAFKASEKLLIFKAKASKKLWIPTLSENQSFHKSFVSLMHEANTAQCNRKKRTDFEWWRPFAAPQITFYLAQMNFDTKPLDGWRQRESLSRNRVQTIVSKTLPCLIGTFLLNLCKRFGNTNNYWLHKIKL